MWGTQQSWQDPSLTDVTTYGRANVPTGTGGSTGDGWLYKNMSAKSTAHVCVCRWEIASRNEKFCSGNISDCLWFKSRMSLANKQPQESLSRVNYVGMSLI